jgi:hypothetical protein
MATSRGTVSSSSTVGRRRPRSGTKRNAGALSLHGCRSVAQLCERVADRRGRRLELLPFALRGSDIHGMLVATEDADFIVYDQDAPFYHQQHIQLHEISHLLYGHLDEADGLQGEQLHTQFPQLERLGAVKVLRRSDYDAHMERQAETLASFLGAALRAQSGPGDENESRAEEMRRVGQSLSRRHSLW